MPCTGPRPRQLPHHRGRVRQAQTIPPAHETVPSPLGELPILDGGVLADVPDHQGDSRRPSWRVEVALSVSLHPYATEACGCGETKGAAAGGFTWYGLFLVKIRSGSD